MKSKKLLEIYNILLENFGKQYWWPAKSEGNARKFEVSIGAILTQNTSWKNVEKALENLRHGNLLNQNSLMNIAEKKLAFLMKPAGYYNQKARKIKAFVDFLEKNDFTELARMQTEKARELLLEVHGIGKETADSILLYALNKLIFVVDAYTRRIFERIFGLKFNDYCEWQKFFMKNLPENTEIFNEYHALLVKLGKDFCRKKPLCGKCPLIKKCNAKF